VSDNVVKLVQPNGVGAGIKVPINGVLAGARAAKLSEVVVIGTDPDGEPYIASSDGACAALWLIEHAKLVLLGVK
jgi:hypothetical protein